MAQRSRLLLTIMRNKLVVAVLAVGTVSLDLAHSFLSRDDDEDDCIVRFQSALANRDGSKARAVAQRCLSTHRDLRSRLQSLYQKADLFVVAENKNETVIDLATAEELTMMARAPAVSANEDVLSVPTVHRDLAGMDCSDPPGPFQVGLWSKCCSKVAENMNSGRASVVIDPFFGSPIDAVQDGDLCASFCCELHKQSTAALYLPFLDELAVSLRVNIISSPTSGSTETALTIQQDGWLRPFDPATVLWPTGYLLALCLAQRCGGIGTVRNPQSILEIGPGVGAALVVAAHTFAPATILAVDASTAALALVRDNLLFHRHASAAGDSRQSRLVLLHANIVTDNDLCDRIAAPVDMVLVSSVPALLQPGDTKSRLDALLDCWLAPGGVAVIAYSLSQPPSVGLEYYERQKVVFANELGLRTRQLLTDGDSNNDEFAILTLQKRQ